MFVVSASVLFDASRISNTSFVSSAMFVKKEPMPVSGTGFKLDPVR